MNQKHIHSRLALVGAVAISLMPVSSVSAAPMMPGGGRVAHGMITHFLEDAEVREQAGITEEQVNQIQERLYEARRDMIARHAEEEAAQLELERLWQSDAPSQEAILQAINSLGALRTAQHAAFAQTRLDVRNMLTAEQREQLKQIAGERVREHRGRFGERLGGFRERLRGGAGGPDQGPGPRADLDSERGPDPFGLGAAGGDVPHDFEAALIGDVGISIPDAFAGLNPAFEPIN